MSVGWVVGFFFVVDFEFDVVVFGRVVGLFFDVAFREEDVSRCSPFDAVPVAGLSVAVFGLAFDPVAADCVEGVFELFAGRAYGFAFVWVGDAVLGGAAFGCGFAADERYGDFAAWIGDVAGGVADVFFIGRVLDGGDFVVGVGVVLGLG